MKNQLTNIALEGTRSGDVVGGLYREPRENLQALFLGRGKNRGVCDRISCLKKLRAFWICFFIA